MSQPYSFGPPEATPEADPPPTPVVEPAPVVEPEPEPAAPEPETDAEPEPQTTVDGGEYQFVYGYPTTYPELGLTFEPGDVHDWPDGPPTDGRWTPTTEKEQ